MEEPRIIDLEEEVIGEDFYEEIEAPKFVDLTAPDRHRTEHDDRYWFCLRVGCDQKHEEEMDSEAIYKNFVLRVMAARSPNIRFRKALCRKDASAKIKCPQTVPPKPSKSRLSRLAMISSISRKVIDAKAQDKPLPKQSATSTPNVKTKQQSKALTTPRNRKRISNPGAFRSVRNPKATAVDEVPKNRVVAKALVFHSPKKAVKLKKSVELGHSIRKLCTGMDKLEIIDGKKDALCGQKTLPVESSRRKVRGREVKSRVFDSLHSQNQKGREGKPSKQLKMRSLKENDLPKDPASTKEIEGDAKQLVPEEKLRDDSADAGSGSETSKSCEGNKHEERLNDTETVEHGTDKSEVLSDTSKSDLTSLSNSEERSASDSDVSKFQLPNEEGNHDRDLEGSSHEGETTSGSKDKEISEAMENDGRDNAASTGDSNKALAIDDKENSLASDINRKLNLASGTLVERSVASKKETPKVAKEMNKVSKDISTCPVKQRKPKPTNPKPFRLRTDERKILKEANLEKKQVLAPLRDRTASSGFHGGKSQKKHQNDVQRDETVNANDSREAPSDEMGIGTPKNQSQQRSSSSTYKPKATGERKFSSSVLRCTISAQQKTRVVSSRVDYGQSKAAQKSISLKKPKSPLKKRLANPRVMASSRKKTASLAKPGQLGTIKETSPTILRPKEATKPIEDGAFLSTKSPASNASGKSPLGRKPTTTIPKEPNFHNIHVPKSCTGKHSPILPTVS